MVNSRKKQTGKKQQSVTQKSSLNVAMWCFYLMWGTVLLVFVALRMRDRMYDAYARSRKSVAEINAALKGVDANASTEDMVRHALRAMVMKG